MRRPLIAFATAATLAACVETPPSQPDTCGASALSGLVGQDRKVLETMKFGGPVRIIEPGMAVTMDYMESRLNISVDEAGRIDRVSCG